MAIGERPLLQALGGQLLTQRLENPYESLFFFVLERNETSKSPDIRYQ